DEVLLPQNQRSQWWHHRQQRVQCGHVVCLALKRNPLLQQKHPNFFVLQDDVTNKHQAKTAATAAAYFSLWHQAPRTRADLLLALKHSPIQVACRIKSSTS